ncbi:MAG: hypothetical protein MJ211_13205 [Bacteroidales bacterium]|nr:hypothetical protein [Bacteroidales bacterium]
MFDLDNLEICPTNADYEKELRLKLIKLQNQLINLKSCIIHNCDFDLNINRYQSIKEDMFKIKQELDKIQNV